MIKADLKNSNKNINADNLLFSDAVELYLEDGFKRVEREDIDINTLYGHIQKIEGELNNYFGNYKISKITSELIENFLDYLRERGNKQKPDEKIKEQTVDAYLRTLNVILNFLVRKKIIDYNPSKDINNKPKPRKTKQELNYFKIDEAKYTINCLNKFADIRLKSFMNIIFALGCRREECAGLSWKDIDFETGEVKFSCALTAYVPKRLVKNRLRKKRLKTDNSYRTNFLPTKCLKYLKQYYELKIACGFEVNPDDFIFTTWMEGRNVDPSNSERWKDNTPVDPNKMSQAWREFKKIHNIKDVDLHRIRHTVANILEKKGTPKKDIAKMLGNTERVLAEFYTHVDYDELNKMRITLDKELYYDMDYIDINIDLVVKILNIYPMNMFSSEELSTLDYLTDIQITDDNYFFLISKIKDLILNNNPDLTYFIDDNNINLNIKIDTYKKFNAKSIKLEKIKDIYFTKDILSL